MALPQIRKKLRADINEAVQRAAGSDTAKVLLQDSRILTASGKIAQKPGRPSPRTNGSVRQTLLLTEETAERLTMAYATEQIRRRKEHERLDKSMFIEEMIISWLNSHKM